MENRNIDSYAYVEHASEFLLESVIEVWICQHVVRRQCYFRHHVRAGDFHLLVINCRREIQTSGFRTVLIDAFQVFLRAHLWNRNGIEAFVRERDVRVQVNAYLFAEEHFGKYQSVGGLGFHHVGLICLNFDGKCIGFGSDTFLYGYVYIVLHLLQQICEILCQFLFVGNGNHLPICLIYCNQKLLIFLVVL